MAETATTPEVTIVPANEANWEDLQAVLGRGYHSGCWCQRFKIRGREWDSGSVPVAERARRLREQTGCGHHPGSGTTSGLVAYLDGEPVGWCAVEPRTAYVRDELRVGSRSIFADARFDEVSHPTLRRVVMRIDF